ncbi:MAG: methyltransferase domain-containing protein [Luteolibacter sp.]
MKISYNHILNIYARIRKVWRENRFEAFKRIIAEKPIESLLDVGGLAGDWFGRVESVKHVTILNLDVSNPFTPTPESPEIYTIQGDARDLPMADGEFEAIYSNSVIEHVGTFEDQMDFAQEVRRVGKKLWIQTPAYSCPVEPHYLGLFVHWIPFSWRWFFIRWTTFVGLTGAAGEGLRAIMLTTRLLTYREYKTLFPDCEIWVERMFWIIPKSYVAYRL